MSEPAVVVVEVEQQTPLGLLRLGLLAPRGCQAVRLLVQPGIVRAAVERHRQKGACLDSGHGGQETGEGGAKGGELRAARHLVGKE